MKLFSSIVLFVIGPIILPKCSSAPSAVSPLNVYQDSCEGKFSKVGIKSLSEGDNNKFIEVIGYYRTKFEMSGLFPTADPQDKNEVLWVDFQNSRGLINAATKKRFIE